MYWRVLGVVAIVCLLVVAVLYAARAESPSAVVRATSTPTIATATAAATASASPTVVVVSISPSATPEATRTPADPAWQQLRRQVAPGVPIIEPTWMPPVFGGVPAASVVAGANAADTTYVVSYHTDRDTVTLNLGGTAPSEVNAGGVGGILVRNSPAFLRFPEYLAQGGQGLRVVSWTEGSYALRIESQTISGDDLLHIAWSLDPTGAPGPAPAIRAKPGVCADAASPELTARRLIALIGSHDPDALADCFAFRGGAYAVWADLPSATLDSIRLVQGTGGRRQLQVGWTFASEPGGAWNLRSTNFFLIGREDGLWRVFAVNTAPFPNPP
jgi:hypothetical protein